MGRMNNLNFKLRSIIYEFIKLKNLLFIQTVRNTFIALYQFNLYIH